MIQFKNVTYEVKGKTLIHLDITFPEQQIVGIVGPNGAGKSTLLKLMTGLIKPSSGEILFNGKSFSRLSRKQLARQIAFVQQHKSAVTDVLVEDAVKLGRTPWKGLFVSWYKEDDAIVKKALSTMNLLALKHRFWRTLSGGEQQRVSLAQGIAQDAPCLILDEPTNHLDIKHQVEMLRWINAQKNQKTMFIALHDLNHAIACCDKVLLLKAGTVQAFDVPEVVLSKSKIENAFGVDVNIRKLADAQFYIDFCSNI